MSNAIIPKNASELVRSEGLQQQCGMCQLSKW